MASIIETIITEHFNTFKPNNEMLVNINNFGKEYSPSEIAIALDYMEDDGFVRLSKKTSNIYGVKPTPRGVDHFRNLIRLNK